MKVLMINTVFQRSSTGRIAEDLCMLLKTRGDDYCAIYGRYDAKDPASVKIGNSLEQGVHVAATRLLDRQGFASNRATRKAIQLIEEYKPDVIHLHNLHGSYINVQILFRYLRKTGVPIVWTLHDCWPFTGHCVYYDYVGCSKWKTGCYQCPKKKSYPASLLLDGSKWNYERKKELFSGMPNLTIVTVSNWLKEQVEDSFLNQYKIQTIYNGVDQNIFAPCAEKEIPGVDLSRKKVLLGVSDGWSDRKGIDHFIRLAENLRDDEELVMVGTTSKDRERLPNNIICFDRTDSARQLAQYYSSASVVLNPSYEETFGLITAEALSCGTPVIVSNATASPELITPLCGRIIEKHDYEGMRKAIDELKTANLKSSCLERARAFSKETNYEKYYALYQQCFQKERSVL